MITSAKNYTEKKKDRQNPKTNGKSKAIQTKYTKKHTYTHPQKEKEEKKIYLCILKKEEESNQINKQIYQ